jgi:hypothetical protein
MLHQIALHRLIPQMNEDINGFMDETRARLADCLKTELALKAKYGTRLFRSEKALQALRSLQRCLNE